MRSVASPALASLNEREAETRRPMFVVVPDPSVRLHSGRLAGAMERRTNHGIPMGGERTMGPW
jgi:hypothetical protein